MAHPFSLYTILFLRHRLIPQLHIKALEIVWEVGFWRWWG